MIITTQTQLRADSEWKNFRSERINDIEKTNGYKRSNEIKENKLKKIIIKIKMSHESCR